MDLHRALTPTARHRCSRRGHGARARRQRLPGAALPHGDAELVHVVDAYELDVRPIRKARVPLDAGTEPEEVATLGLATHDRVRVADRHGRELDLLVAEVERLGLPHLDRSEVELDVPVRAHARVECARAHRERYLV